MLNLDFAILNMMEKEKKGLVYQKLILDKLAPLFFSPRVENLLDLEDVGSKGCKLILPLGNDNWNQLTKNTQEQVLNKSSKIMKEYSLNTLAVDRRLKSNFHELSNNFSMVFGDNFIKALSINYLEQMLSKREVKRIIIAGIIPDLDIFIEKLCDYSIPVSLQNFYPSKYEQFAYRLLYDKGVAVSTSFVTPSTWEKGDLIFIFEPQYQRYTVASPDSFFIKLTDNRQGISLELEEKLKKSGLNSSLYNLAPVLESCLISKAGINNPYEENKGLTNVQEVKKNTFEQIKQVADDLDIWELFS
ncbi:hypothetical protein SYNTR_1901 [Candidatus Syntrophocurvum alkaliphilum]|uniref:Uncharacterized protein n=1 Tax=Candidatus Syntrophocurvum alkaliphilum TaxID=2293317 RepID=A0A6I6DCX5_9FIRM|nr:hypothetical protein [Candidatus Syntrophocurvum alkaliphilum]QGU00495.1 hypothetical protein SYNTR_1901 [Candidatus Syntrophocurvum alkaliphilum]